jgi:uncharacterized protein
MNHIAPSNASVRVKPVRQIFSRLYVTIALCIAIAPSANAYPGEQSNATLLTQAQASTLSTDVSAVAAESDRKTADDYNVLKLAASHLPNERHRIDAAVAAANGRWGDAARMFRLAARYADKYSQHRLSMLYWHGVGVARDPVEAYVWADLAAERGYPQFLAIREQMWNRLTPVQQTAVAARGDALYAEFGDPAAKPRLAHVLARAKHNMTGSRTGFAGFLGVTAFQKNRLLPDLFENAAVATIYNPERINPERYWTIEDRVWKEGAVTVGDLEDTKVLPKAQTPAKTP